MAQTTVACSADQLADKWGMRRVDPKDGTMVAVMVFWLVEHSADWKEYKSVAGWVV